MLKFFYRLRRRRGMVLFVVIAIMTLLIAMATTAYFTARSSYKTVVSNYDFSQMYLSATSVSDMVIAAATQDSSESTINNFTGLKSQVQALKTKAAGTDAAKITGVSNNISATATEAATYAAAGANPIEPGVLDAVKVTISLDKMEANKPNTGLNTYYFTFMTTAYYRDNMITVSDSVYNVSGTEESATLPFDTFFTATGQTLDSSKHKDTRAVVIDTQAISDNAYFENAITIFTTVQGGGNSNIFLGGVSTSGSLFFTRNFNAKIPPAGKAWNLTGKDESQYLNLNEATDLVNDQYARHDWIIGGDLGFLSDNNGELNLRDNNLYVKGDLIIGNAKCITAKNIYVLGNIYISNSGGGARFNVSGGVYCAGDIRYASKDVPFKNNKTSSTSYKFLDGSDASTCLADGIQKLVNNACASAGTSISNDIEPKIEGAGNGIQMTGKLYMSASGKVDPDHKFSHMGEGNKNATHYFIPQATKFDPDTQKEKISRPVAQDEEYVFKENEMTISEILNPDNEASPTHTHGYSNYTAKETTMKNTLTIDFSDMAIPDTGAKVDGKKVFQGTFYVNNSETGSITAAKATITVIGSDAENPNIVMVDLPYLAEGYKLKIKPSSKYPSGKNAPVYYNIHTADDGSTMPIVLEANFKDGTGQAVDASGNNAFSWKASGYDTNGGSVYVQLVNQGEHLAASDPTNANVSNAKGNVIFEMGNYDSSGYISYDSTKYSTTDTVTYYTSQKEFLGTKQQLTKLRSATSGGEPWSDKKACGTMLQSGSDPNPTYENRVMLVSSKNKAKTGETKGVAFDAYRIDNLFCGYMYAPNGTFQSKSQNGVSMFGGLIVSDYLAVHSDYVYAEPNPKIISSLLAGLDGEEGGESTPAEGIWYINGPNIGRNYLG